jgi:hypothetical protein
MGIGDFFRRIGSGITDFGKKAGGFLSDFAGGFRKGFQGTMDTLLPFVSKIPVIGSKIDGLARPVGDIILGVTDTLGDVGRAAQGQSSWGDVFEGVKSRISQGKQDFESVRDQIGRLRGAGK